MLKLTQFLKDALGRKLFFFFFFLSLTFIHSLKTL